MKYAIIPALLFSFSILGVNSCTESEDPPAAASPIRILEPKSGATFKESQKFKVITESDYDTFKQNLTFDATPDSGKTWVIGILSLGEKTGMKVRDTIEVSFDTLFFTGKTKIRVWEYGKKFYSYTDWIEITK